MKRWCTGSISGWLIAGLGLHAQPAEVTRYDVDQGLPQSMVNHVLQDRDGFIWLGTGDGLARFDGSRFVVYKHDPHDGTSLSHNAIWGLAEADAEHLYIGTRSGLDVLDRRTGRCTHTLPGPDGCWRALSTTPDRALFYSPLTGRTLVRENGTFQQRATGHTASYCLRTSDDGNMLHAFIHPDTLLTFDTRNGSERVVILPTTADDRVRDMIRSPAGWLVLTEHTAWIWTDDAHVQQLPADTRSLLEQEPGTKYVARDPSGTLWIGISGVGVVTLGTDLSVQHVYALLPANDGPLRITGVFFDRQGNTWVGSDGKGVFRIAPKRIKFGRVMPGQQNGWHPPSWFVRGFAQWDPHRVLVSFDQGGLALFDEGTHKLAAVDLPALRSTGTYEQLTRDADGTIWLLDGTALLAIDPLTRRLATCEAEPTGRSVLLDREGHLLVISPNSTRRYRSRQGVATYEDVRMPGVEAWLDSVHNAPRFAAMDRLGRLWVSSAISAVDVWAPDGARTRPLPADVRINHLFDNGDGTEWISTNDGAYAVDRTTLRITRHVLPGDGLPDRFLYGMVESGDGERWIASNRGLSRAGKGLGSIRNYTVADGLQSMEFNSRAFFRSASGRLYFGGINGFNHFLPEEVTDDPNGPSVSLVHAWAQDSLVVLPDVGGRLELPFPRNRLELELAVLDMSAPQLAAFRYRMVGFQDEWRTASPQRPLVLERIPSGSYTLEVQGINADGVSGPISAPLRIAVLLPFWASPWAFALAGVLLAGLFALIVFLNYRRRAKARLLVAEHEVKDLRMRTRLAQDIHDDVGSGLARMAALSRSPKRAIDPDARFEKLSDISGELLENLRDVVWLNDPRNGTLASVLTRLRDHATDLFEGSGTHVVCDFPEPLPARVIGGTARRNLFLIAKEALQNARKYSGAERLVLYWRDDRDGFTLRITDNGGGINSEVPQGSGHGSVNMRQRAEEMSAIYERTAATGGGTVVRVHGRTSCLDG